MLGGCTLIDQRSFLPRPPPAVIAAAPIPADLALVTIPLGTAGSVYRAPLGRAVRAALAKKPLAAFLVVTAVPAAGDPAGAAGAALAARGEAVAVMRRIRAEGVARRRVRLMARSLPGSGRGEIRVYVR